MNMFQQQNGNDQPLLSVANTHHQEAESPRMMAKEPEEGKE
jgi:hypothetical protein